MIRCSRAMSWAVASTWPSGGRRNTKRWPSPSVTAKVRLDRPPAMSSKSNGATAPSMFGSSHRLTRAVSMPCTDGDTVPVVSRVEPTPTTLFQLTAATFDDLAGCRRVDHRATADVDADVADRRVVEDQVARLDLVLWDVRDRAVLRGRLVRQVHAGLAPRVLRETRAVERDARRLCGEPVRHTELAHGRVDGNAGHRRHGWCRIASAATVAVTGCRILGARRRVVVTRSDRHRCRRREAWRPRRSWSSALPSLPRHLRPPASAWRSRQPQRPRQRALAFLPRCSAELGLGRRQLLLVLRLQLPGASAAWSRASRRGRQPAAACGSRDSCSLARSSDRANISSVLPAPCRGPPG